MHYNRFYYWEINSSFFNSFTSMNAYHTTIKICYALGLQNQMVDVSIRKQIPHSTAHYWKNNTNPKEYIGADCALSIGQKLSDIQNEHHPLNKVPLKLFSAYCNFTVSIVKRFEKKTIQRLLRTKKEDLLYFLKCFYICRYFRISSECLS